MDVLIDKHGCDSGADLSSSIWIAKRYIHIETGQVVGASFCHGDDGSYFDRFLQLSDEVFHRLSISVVREQSILTDDRFQPAAAQDLLLHAGKALAHVRCVHWFHEV